MADDEDLDQLTIDTKKALLGAIRDAAPEVGANLLATSHMRTRSQSAHHWGNSRACPSRSTRSDRASGRIPNGLPGARPLVRPEDVGI